ncbi:uncharacterized protein [Cicer arietinum]|uniref:uncharacterized protein n=1 Tax=Cicer arietinum TaxID=3827 RepID=UPI003CC6D9A5
MEGEWKDVGEKICVVNIYPSCDMIEKRELWNMIDEKVENDVDCCWCVCGDFNAIRKESEKKGRSEYIQMEDILRFNNFIEESEFIDLSLNGRAFTWCRLDGSVMSILERFLLSKRWGRQSPNCLQWALDRGLSDHCPLFLCDDWDNWRPRPFRMLKCWEEFDAYKDFVKEAWDNCTVLGWEALC